MDSKKSRRLIAKENNVRVWAFVDFENVNSFSKIDFRKYDKVIVFVGSKQDKINFSGLCHGEMTEITFFKVTVTSLENYIVTSSSALNGSAESLEIRRYIKKLVDSGHIQVEGEKVLYGKGFSLCTSKN